MTDKKHELKIYLPYGSVDEKELDEIIKKHTIYDDLVFMSLNEKNEFHSYDDKPALAYVDGRKYWYVNGIISREGGPAIEDANGTKHWVMNGKRHRENGPALEDCDGYKEWLVNGKLHREDGPAMEFDDGYKAWCKNGLFHREDGPAIEHPDGRKEWWINGEKINKPCWRSQLKQFIIKYFSDDIGVIMIRNLFFESFVFSYIFFGICFFICVYFDLFHRISFTYDEVRLIYLFMFSFFFCLFAIVRSLFVILKNNNNA